MTVEEFKKFTKNRGTIRFFLGTRDVTDRPGIDEMIVIGAGYEANGDVNVDVRLP